MVNGKKILFLHKKVNVMTQTGGNMPTRSTRNFNFCIMRQNVCVTEIYIRCKSKKSGQNAKK